MPARTLTTARVGSPYAAQRREKPGIAPRPQTFHTCHAGMALLDIPKNNLPLEEEVAHASIGSGRIGSPPGKLAIRIAILIHIHSDDTQLKSSA